MKFSVSTSLLAAGKCQVRWLGRSRRGRKEWEKRHTKATERLCLAEGCDYKTERGEEWNVKVGEQWSAVFPPWGRRSPPLPPPPSPPPPPLPLWLVHSWSVCRGGASQHYSRPVEFPWGVEGGSSGSSPHIKMTKQKKTPPKTTKMKSNERSETRKGSRWRWKWITGLQSGAKINGSKGFKRNLLRTHS